MDHTFIFLRSFESVSDIQFIKLGYMGMYKPEDGGNIKLDSYFDAKPIELTEHIQKFYITTQYTVFTDNSAMFAHFNITTPFEIATQHLTLTKDQLEELINLHVIDCITHTNILVIRFPNGETVTMPQNMALDTSEMAKIFEEKLLLQRWNLNDPPE